MKNIFVRWIFFLLLAEALGISISGAAGETVLITATDFPPYEFETPENGLRGFDVEVAETAFSRVGIQAEFAFYPWTRAIQMGIDGKAGGVLTCAKNPDRKHVFIFSDPISKMTDIFLVRKDYNGPPIRNIRRLKQMNLYVGTVRGWATAERLTHHGVPFDVSNSTETAIQKLADGRIDVLPSLLENIGYLIRKMNMKGRFTHFVMNEYLTNEFHICFTRKRPDARALVDRFNQGLAAVRANGAYDAIHAKYR